MTEGSSI